MQEFILQQSGKKFNMKIKKYLSAKTIK